MHIVGCRFSDVMVLIRGLLLFIGSYCKNFTVKLMSLWKLTTAEECYTAQTPCISFTSVKLGFHTARLDHNKYNCFGENNDISAKGDRLRSKSLFICCRWLRSKALWKPALNRTRTSAIKARIKFKLLGNIALYFIASYKLAS